MRRDDGLSLELRGAPLRGAPKWSCQVGSQKTKLKLREEVDTLHYWTKLKLRERWIHFITGIEIMKFESAVETNKGEYGE